MYVKNSPAWRDLLVRCDKTQFGSISRIAGRLSDNNIAPTDVTDAIMRVVLKQMEDQQCANGRARLKLKHQGLPKSKEQQQAEIDKMEARQCMIALAKINSFVRHFNAAIGWADERALKPVPGKRLLAAAEWDAFGAGFCADVDAYLAKRDIASKAWEGNAIRRCCRALKKADRPFARLGDLLNLAALKLITRSYGKIDEENRTRSYDLQTLANVATFLKDARGAKLVAAFRKKCVAASPEISIETIEILSPYFANRDRRRFFGVVEKRAVLPADFDADDLYTVQAALAVLLSARMPATPKFTCALEFAGAPRQGDGVTRPLLSHPEFCVDNLERCLDPVTPVLLDRYFLRLQKRLRKAPETPFVEMDGVRRSQDKIVHFVANLLSEIAPDISFLDVREIGVIELYTTRRFSTAQLAVLTRYDDQNFINRYTPLFDAIEAFQDDDDDA